MSPVTASANMVRRSVAQITERAPERQRSERPALEVVHGPARRANRRVWVVAGVVALFGVFFALTIFQTMLLENQQQLDRLDKEVAAAQDQNARQTLDVARQQSPENIVGAAQKLGLTPAVGPKYLAPSPDAAAAAQAADGGAKPADDPPSSAASGTQAANQQDVKASLGTSR